MNETSETETAKGKMMKYERTIKTLEKAGFSIARKTQPSSENPSMNIECQFIASKPNSSSLIAARKQGDRVVTLKVLPANDPDNSTTDYFPGIYVDTVKRAIALFR